MDTRSDSAVDDEFCDWTTQPVDINACHVACPGDCVLSAWSEWSTCPKVHILLFPSELARLYAVCLINSYGS